MDRRTLAPYIDHTVLGPETTLDGVETVLDDAAEYGMNACIPPCYLEDAVAYAPDVTIATVIAFPHGQESRAVKRRAGVLAWQAGADELDVVINVGRLRQLSAEIPADSDDESLALPLQVADSETIRSAAVTVELAELVAAVPIPVKVIIETAILTTQEKHLACQVAREADAAMVKTSTGFADGGATVTDVSLMCEYLPVKASGGIRTYDDAMALIDAGADRIGASRGVDILEDAPTS